MVFLLCSVVVGVIDQYSPTYTSSELLLRAPSMSEYFRTPWRKIDRPRLVIRALLGAQYTPTEPLFL